MLNLTEIKAACEKASKGKHWIDIVHSDGCKLTLYNGLYNVWFSATMDTYEQAENDALLIAKAHRFLPELVAEVERLEVENSNLSDKASHYLFEFKKAEQRVKALEKKISEAVEAFYGQSGDYIVSVAVKMKMKELKDTLFHLKETRQK